MNERSDTLKVLSMDSACLEGNHERLTKIKGKDKKLWKVIKNIQDLDVSMQKLEQQLEIIRAESLDFQLKNCEELKSKLATELPENETLAKNTQRFLELFAAEEKNRDSFDKSYVKSKNHIQSANLEEKNEPRVSESIADEEKKRPNTFTSDATDSENEKNFDRSYSTADLPVELNPFSIDESSKKLLKKLEDELKKLDRRK